MARQSKPAWLRIVRKPLAHAEAVALADLPEGRIRSAADAVALLRPKAEAEEQEVFYLIILDAMSRVLGQVEVTRGTATSTLVHPREVFRLAILYGGTAIIVAHNHPAGGANPSSEDRVVTRQLVAAGALLDIPVFDHVIIAGDGYFSFANAGLL